MPEVRSALEIKIARTDVALATQATAATSLMARARGLLGRASLEHGEALVLEPCSMVHMFFMLFAIDVIFCDADNSIVRIYENLRPWRVSPWVPSAVKVVELPAHALHGIDIVVGDTLTFH